MSRNEKENNYLCLKKMKKKYNKRKKEGKVLFDCVCSVCKVKLSLCQMRNRKTS